MGIFDDLFGGGGGKSDKWKAQQAKKKKNKQKAKEKKKTQAASDKEKEQEAREKAAWQGDLGEATSRGTEGAQSYFSNRGLDPNSPEYADAIQRAIEDASGGIPDQAQNLPSYFSGIGESVYNELQDALRTRSSSAIDQLLPQGFETNRIANTLDDDIISQLMGESRGKAEQYAQNLLDRGVVTQAGYGAAQTGINEQEARIRELLNSLGGNILSSGRDQLSGIADEGRFRAGGLNLGQSFDPNEYASRIDQAFNEFTSTLGDKFRAQAPSTLFDTSNLAALAGQGQGAQNTKFNSNALIGALEGEDDEEEARRGSLSIF